MGAFMQESNDSQQIQQRIDGAVSAVKEKIANETNPIRKRVWEIQLSHLQLDPERYFGKEEKDITDVYWQIASPLLDDNGNIPS